jgi:hypothetical protein
MSIIKDKRAYRDLALIAFAALLAALILLTDRTAQAEAAETTSRIEAIDSTKSARECDVEEEFHRAERAPRGTSASLRP